MAYINLGLSMWPVGSVYISYSGTSPASIFGGTWTAITGRFPYFNAGTGTGGSNTHTLTIAEMPSHNHNLNYISASGDNGVSDYLGGSTASYGIAHNTTITGSYSDSIAKTGGGGAHNNMPAYQTLYAWRRTA